jgi:hypothetical protein
MLNQEWPWLPFQLFFGMVAFFAVFLTVIFRLEKRTVSPYGELESAPPFADPTGYAARWVADAVQAGFVLLGWARDTRGSIYQCSYALLVSADRTTFMVISVGTIMKIPMQGTWLHTPAMDGRSFNTTDKQAGVQIDLSGNWTNQLAVEPSFGQLLQKHCEWLQILNVFPRPFSPHREFDEFKALRAQHYRSMERAGLIRFADASATQFYYTLPGAAKTATWSDLVGVIRGLSHGSLLRSA